MKIAVVVISILLEFIIVSMAVPRSLINWSSTLEGRWMLSMYGPEWNAKIREYAQESFNRIFHDSGLIERSYYLLLPTEEEWERGEPFTYVEDSTGIFSFLEGRLEVFWLEIQQDVQRFVQLGIWLSMLAPVWLFLMLDGWYYRELKKATFGYQSPFLHRYALWASGWLWVILSFFTLLPVPIPPQTYPIAMLFQGALLGVIVANIHKKI